MLSLLPRLPQGLCTAVMLPNILSIHPSRPSSVAASPLQVQPAIYVTYNGDYFDWPFIGAPWMCLLGQVPMQRRLWVLMRWRWLALAVTVPGPLTTCRLLLLPVPFRAHFPPVPAVASETRAAKHGMDMEREIGFACNRKSNETLSRWVMGGDQSRSSSSVQSQAAD